MLPGSIAGGIREKKRPAGTLALGGPAGETDGEQVQAEPVQLAPVACPQAGASRACPTRHLVGRPSLPCTSPRFVHVAALRFANTRIEGSGSGTGLASK